MQQLRRGGGIGRGLQHHAVARRNGCQQGIHRQQEGIVPRSHNQHLTIGLLHGEAAGGPLGERRVIPCCRRQRGQVRAQIMQLLPHQHDLRFIGLEGALAQIGKQRLLNGLLMGIHLYRFQAMEAEIQRQGLSLIEICPLFFAQLLNGKAIRFLHLQGGQRFRQGLCGEVLRRGQLHLLEHALRQSRKLVVAQTAPCGGHAPRRTGVVQPLQEGRAVALGGSLFSAATHA